MSGFGLGVGLQNISEQAIDSSTPWVAAADGNLELLQVAMSKLGLGVNSRDENGYGFLQAAASYSRVEVIQWLLANGADILGIDNDGDSALHYASTPEACKLLVAGGIDPQLKNASGHNALVSKQIEMNELKEDEDFEENDPDSVALQGVIEYLTSLSNRSQ